MMHIKNTIAYPATQASRKLTPTNLILGNLVHFRQLRHFFGNYMKMKRVRTSALVCLLALIFTSLFLGVSNESAQIHAQEISTSSLDEGLVAHYPFNGNANDESGNGNDGTVYGASLTADRFGNANSAYSFDEKTNDFIKIQDDQDFIINNCITISAWMKFIINPYSISQSRSYILDKCLNWRLWYSSNGEGASEPRQFFLDLWDWEGVNTNITNWKADTFYHIVGTYDGSQAKIYINGKLNNINTFSKSLRINDRNVHIGASSDSVNGSDFFNGVIDDIRIYNRALSEGEIQELYNLAHPTTGIDEYTVLMIHSNDSDGSTSFVDSSNSGHTINTAGDVHHESDQARFGATSIHFDGSGDYLKIPDSASWTFGSGDFTVDFWVKHTSLSGTQYYYCQSGQNAIGIQWTGSQLKAFTGPPWTGRTYDASLDTDTWYHIALVGIGGNTVKLFLNGIALGADWSFNYNIDPDSGGTWDGTWIGGNNGLNPLSGYIDEFRISKGIARWTSNFTPPVKPYDPGPITVTLDLPSGWSMVSLPINPTDKKLEAVFPNAVVVYRYEKGTGYVRVLNNEELEVGKGYWILLDEATSYTITGQLIASYTLPADEDGWAMIGGCTDPAKVSPNGCDIGVIYHYVQGTGYQRVTASQPLEAGEGYWILLNNVAEGATVTVETVD
jgi:hypothetical protein